MLFDGFDGDTEERPQHEQSQGEGLKSPTASKSICGTRKDCPSKAAKRTELKEESSQPSLQLFVLHSAQVLHTLSTDLVTC